MLKRKLALATAVVVALGIPALAAGLWSTLPVVGGGSFCASTVTGTGGLGGITGQGQGSTGSICGQTVPAGPPLITGSELIPADTGLAGGAPPQTVVIPESMLGGPRINRLIGGDFNTNLWQRGTTPVSAVSASTSVIGADRWAVQSTGNVITVIKETASAVDRIDSLGLYASMRVSRPSATDVTQICTGQILDKQAAAPLIGNNAVFSTYLLAGAGFNAAVTNSNVTMVIAYWTAGDSSTPFTNTDLFMKSTITGYTAVAAPSQGTTGVAASGVVTVPISTTWTRYAVWGAIPATNAAGTAVVGVGVKVCYTPAAGTTGGSTEWFEMTGAQLEAQPMTVTASLPSGVTAPRGFERRPASYESGLQQYYTTGGGLGAELTGTFYQAGGCAATGNANFGIIFPTPMRVAPTAATSTLTAGGYSIQTAVAVTAIGTITFPTATVYGLTLNSNAACTATLPYQLKGTNTTGLILFSAEP